MNREDYISDKTADKQMLVIENTKLKRIIDRLQNENDELDLKNMSLPVHIKEHIKDLISKYQGHLLG
jgi:hypothetical protein